MTSLPQTVNAIRSTPTVHETGWSVARLLVAHPAVLLFTAIGLITGVCLAGLWGMTAVALSAVSLAVVATRSDSLREWAARHRTIAERQRRTLARTTRLEAGAADRTRQLAELNRVVEQIEDGDSVFESADLGLQDLLDRYVDLAIAHTCYLDAARRADLRFPSPVLDGEPPIDDDPDRQLRRELAARRHRHRHECRRRAAELEAEIDAIVEFIQLVDQKAACPTFDVERRDEVQRRLWELVALETAHRQLLP
jgi:hypothetical protein